MTCRGVDVLTVLTRWLRAGSEPLLCRGTAEQSFCWVTASARQEMSGDVGRCREMSGDGRWHRTTRGNPSHHGTSCHMSRMRMNIRS